MGRRGEDKKRGWRRLVGAAALTLGVGALAFFLTATWVQAVHQRAAERHSADLASNLRTGLATPVEALYALQAYLQTQRAPRITPAQFRAFCQPAIARHPEIAALEWFPLVPGAERAEFERLVAEDQPGFEIREPTRAGPLVRALDRPQHVPLIFMEPYLAMVQGLDLAFDPLRIAPVERALSSGRTTVSDRFQLVEDPPEILSVAAYAPVTDAYWVDRQATSGKAYGRGVAVALFRLTPLVHRALRNLTQGGLAYELLDPSAPPEARTLFRQGTIEAGALRIETDVGFVDRTYRFVVYSKEAEFSLAPYVVLFMTMLSCAALMALSAARRRSRKLERAAERLGQYQLERKIASGGMGSVYRAHHALLKRPTAIKIAHEEQAAANFEKEVLLTSTLTHPNTVLVYDFGRGEDGEFYYAMEYIEGYDLEELVQLYGPLPPGRAIRVLLQITASLAEAHAKGLVHRDVKPSNIMLTERGGTRDFVKVLDFGLARTTASTVPSTSFASAAFAGTPGYAAPEVVAGSVATARSDIFSLGAVAYFLLTGRGPFHHASSPMESLTRALTSAPDPLPPAVPEPLARVVMSCLAKTAEMRPQSMQVVSERLREAVSACAPWTQSDAEAWWQAHPRRAEAGAAPVSAKTFVPAGRGLTSSKLQSSESAIRKAR